MFIRLILCFILLSACPRSADAAISITIAPDGLGGTTYTFIQTSPNPTLSVALASSSALKMELPPGMFDPIILGGTQSGDITGTFDKIARLQDVGSGFQYDVVGLFISSTLSSASFEFHRPFAQGPGQTNVQFELVSGAPGLLTVSPDALVEGTHSIGSTLFGTVTVHVIPESTSVSLAFLGSLLLARRQRHPRQLQNISGH